MTIELLEKRKQDLISQQNQLIASANAINGAIQDCDYWIVQIKQAEATAAQVTEPVAQ